MTVGDHRLSTKHLQSGMALVLGGGGVAGIAWMTGLVCGLANAGADLRAAASLLVGTSAGSAVAAQIASPVALDDLFQRQVDPDRQVAEIAPELHILQLVGNLLPVLLKLADPVERTRRIGTLACKATTIDEAVRRQVIAARLPSHEWPDRALSVVAVDVATGEPRIFDRYAGVDLVDAVAASCAVPGIWPPVTIGGNRYMDGGMRSSDNADLAKGFTTAVVISPIGAGGITLPGSPDLSSQVAALERDGTRVQVIEPDEASKHAIGHDPLSPTTRVPAARAGYAQAAGVATLIADLIRAG